MDCRMTRCTGGGMYHEDETAMKRGFAHDLYVLRADVFEDCGQPGRLPNKMSSSPLHAGKIGRSLFDESLDTFLEIL